MAETWTAAEVARGIAEALALGFYSPPRATLDVDVNVFVSPDEGIEHILSALGHADFVPSSPPDRLESAAREEGQFGGTSWS